jgi:outer membrane protein W
MKSVPCVAAIVAFALSVSLATMRAPCAEASSQLSSGSIEFSPSVSFSHSNLKREGYGNVDTSTRLEVTPTIGYCISNHYEVNGGVMTRHQSTNGNSETALGATAGLQYNFSPHGTVIPYAGVGFGTLFYDGFSLDNTAVLAPMLTGGIRVLVGSSASVNMSLGFQHEDNAEGESGVSANRLIAGVGVSLFPWPAH